MKEKARRREEERAAYAFMFAHDALKDMKERSNNTLTRKLIVGNKPTLGLLSLNLARI